MRLTIEKLIYGGDGLARGPADEHGKGKAIFVPFVLAGERVEAEITEQKPGFMRARATKLLAASEQRAEPGCPYFGQCGGCQYQHAAYDHQLHIKAGILRETLARLARTDAPPVTLHASPPWNYRNRTRMKVRAGGEFALGYYRFSSHELLPVERCPISSALINRAVAALWQLGPAGDVSPAVQGIEFFADAEDKRLLVELTLPDNYWKQPAKPSVVHFAAELRRALPEVAGIAVFRTTPRGLVREDVPRKLRDTFGDDELVYHARGCEYHVTAGSFFQTNRYLTGTLIDLVVDHSGNRALDLYAGTGLFTLPLSQQFRDVIAVEAAPFSFHDLKRNVPSNVKCVRDITERFLGGVNYDDSFDLTIVDPPRGGLGEKVAKLIGGLLCPRLTYVSCDPATLARDLKFLTAAGFRIAELHLVDLFPQTFHIESVVKLVR
ncbi:MAG: class I SAM-dependent RNA methyltransferase [Terriglobales bacterium]